LTRFDVAWRPENWKLTSDFWSFEFSGGKLNFLCLVKKSTEEQKIELKIGNQKVEFSPHKRAENLMP
jgi:hypothetical protein